ncbi:MAG: hypothetical protein K8J08_04925 [Thermoanaerobaculia bacterium]|nr:hypothetical protein [Thermoanaerobaculia bacterium]
MKERRIELGGASVKAIAGWVEIEEEADAGHPFTLTKGEAAGVGSLQFTLAFYEKGEQPDPSVGDLIEMLNEFGNSRRLGVLEGVATDRGPLILAAGSFRSAGDFIRAWYVSDGWHFALVTYVCGVDNLRVGEEELRESEEIVRSLRFDQQASVRP